nr:uncharacterized protein LOC129271502 [Lytechinus pictus]
MAFRIRSYSLILVSLGMLAFCTLPAKGNRQFIFAPMPNEQDESPNIGVVIQALEENETNINVLFPRMLFEDQITLPPGSGPYNYPLPNSLIKQTATDVLDSTVVLTSDQNIKVISYNIAKATSDMFSVVPMKNLGKEYFLALFSIMTSEKNFRGTVTISALDKKAMIEIFLNSTVQFQNAIYYNGDILRYILRPFESLQLRPKYTNITGSRVVSNTSVTVTVGTDCADVPEGIQYCDHLAEQLAPFEAWGELHVLSPFPMKRSGYLFQIVAGRNNTTVSYKGTKRYMNMGDYITVDIPSQNMTLISADKPISVIQYVKGRRSDDVSDPSMIRVIPVEQYVKSTVFPVEEANRLSTMTKIDTVYLEITSECKYLNNISVFKNYQPLSIEWIEEYSLKILNGTEICSRWSVVTHGRYSVESDRVITDDGQTIYPRFRAVVYAKGDGESFVYRAGSNDRTLNSESDSATNTGHLLVLIKPHIVAVEATELVVSWVITEDGVGLFDRCTALITGDTRARSVYINTEPPVSLSGLHPRTTYSIRINCSNNFGIHDCIDFPPETTLNAVPDRPSVLHETVGGIDTHSFQVNVPSHTTSTGQISCYEFIVVQLHNSSGNIDSDDDAYNDVSNYNITSNKIGIPFRVTVLKSLPIDNVITIGSVIERQSECNMADGHSKDDERTKRDARIVNGTTLKATNGPLIPGGYYTCFLRVYSPTGEGGKFYYANGPAMKPIQLRHLQSILEDAQSGMNYSAIVTPLSCILLLILIIIGIVIYRRKRSNEANVAPKSSAYESQTKPNEQKAEDYTRYNQFSGQQPSEDIYENTEALHEDDEYQNVTFESNYAVKSAYLQNMEPDEANVAPTSSANEPQAKQSEQTAGDYTRYNQPSGQQAGEDIYENPEVLNEDDEYQMVTFESNYAVKSAYLQNME